jgi:hypothetical protein
VTVLPIGSLHALQAARSRFTSCSAGRLELGSLHALHVGLINQSIKWQHDGGFGLDLPAIVNRWHTAKSVAEPQVLFTMLAILAGRALAGAHGCARSMPRKAGRKAMGRKARDLAAAASSRGGSKLQRQ